MSDFCDHSEMIALHRVGFLHMAGSPFWGRFCVCDITYLGTVCTMRELMGEIADEGALRNGGGPGGVWEAYFVFVTCTKFFFVLCQGFRL